MSIAALLVSSVARAQTPEVERLLRHGIELRQQGSNEAALAEFRRAHQLANTPRTLAQVALAEQALGRWVEAEAHLREAMRGRNDPWVARNRAALDGAMGVIAQHVGLVMVRCDVDGAVLEVNGREVGALPMDEPLRVAAGEAEVVVRAGGRRATLRVQVSAGETARVVMSVAEPRNEPHPIVSSREPEVSLLLPDVPAPHTETQRQPSNAERRPLRRLQAPRGDVFAELTPAQNTTEPPAPIYRLSIDLGGGVGVAVLSGTPEYAESFVTDTGESLCPGYTCSRSVVTGAALTSYFSANVRYNVSARVGVALGMRLQSGAGDWTVQPPGDRYQPKDNAFANLLLYGRIYVALSSSGWSRSGAVVSLFLGGGGGQIQPRPDPPSPSGTPSAHVLSGYGNVQGGWRLEYGIGEHFHLAGELALQFMVPTFLFDVDATVFAGVHL